MSAKKVVAVFAGIDVGSYALRMKISQVFSNGEHELLDILRYPISPGSETYTTGKVSFETVDRICSILTGFKKLMNEYRVGTYRAVATSAIREASNKDYIIDQIRLKTGLDVEVINNAQERFLTYKAIRENLTDVKKLREEGLMIVTVGSGSVELSFYFHNKLVLSQNIRMGPLRLRELLADIEGKTLDYPKLLEEEIDSSIDRIKTLVSLETCRHFLAIGGEIRTISKLCNNKTDYEDLKYIHKEDFIRLYKDMVNKSPEEIEKYYNITPERAHILVPSMLILKRFMEMSQAAGIHAPLIYLRDGIISDLIDTKFDTERKNDFISDIISYTRHLAARYLYHQAHAEAVEKFSLQLFDSLQKLHGLKTRERLLLQLATILHDTGKYINFNSHYVHSYNIIMGTELFGISEEELEIIANVSRYHSKEVPRYTHENFLRLNDKNKVVVSKLAAIIRLADALDSTHKQKIPKIEIALKDNHVIISVESKHNLLLEEWTFGTKAEFFREVFGVVPVFQIKGSKP